jgi:hypothetical protein
MSTLSQFFSSGGGVHTSDPKQLTRVTGNSFNLRIGTSVDISSSSTFYTKATTALNTDFVADTYKTLVSVTSGAGFVSGILGPAQSAASETTTFRITVDGTATTLAVTLPASTGHRACLGRFRYYSASATDPRDLTSDIGSAGASVVAVGTTPIMALTPAQSQALGVGMLRYARSLTIEVKHSAGVTATASAERQSCAWYTVE